MRSLPFTYLVMDAWGCLVRDPLGTPTSLLGHRLIGTTGTSMSRRLHGTKSLLSGNSEDRVKRQLTALIEREGDGYVSICPELDIASQGDIVEEARANLVEAVELFFEAASETEIDNRLHEEMYVTRLEVTVG